MKIIIIGSSTSDYKKQLSHKLVELNDNLCIGNTFTTDIEYKDKLTEDFVYYMPHEEAELGYVNNAFMYVTSTKEYTKGISLSDMYSDDIFVLEYMDFNNISEKVMSELGCDNLFVVVDERSKHHTNTDIIEARYSEEKLQKMQHVLYFIDEDIKDVATIILYYINPDRTEEELANCREENS